MRIYFLSGDMPTHLGLPFLQVNTNDNMGQQQITTNQYLAENSPSVALLFGIKWKT